MRTLSGDPPLPILQTPSAGHCLDTHGNWRSHRETVHFFAPKSVINRTSKWQNLKTQQTLLNGQNVHRFQDRTPICHIVPVSRAYTPPHLCYVCPYPFVYALSFPLQTHLFLCILFSFFCPVRPTLPRSTFLPQNPPLSGTSDLLFFVKATCKGWVLGTVLDGVAPQEKRKILFSGAREKR